MHLSCLRWILIALLLCPPFYGSQSQEARSLLHSCWSPSILREKKNENLFVRSTRTFDTPTPSNGDILSNAIPPDLQGPIRRVRLKTNKKLLALTFDLCELMGEVAGYDGALIDYLRTNQFKATFFAGGKWMRSHSERTQQLMMDPLFEVANHSEAHRNLRLLKNQALKDEILGPQHTFQSLRSNIMKSECVQGMDTQIASFPDRMHLFRFPFGACNEAAQTAVNEAGFLIIQWDISLGDPVKAQTAEAIANILLKAKPGSIIIGHANGHGYHTAEALKIALPELRKRGFEFVTVTELLLEGTPEISSSCYNVRPGDTDKYDVFFKNRNAQHSK